MIARIQNGDYGQVFRGTFKSDGAVLDVSSATTKQVIFRDPDGVVSAKTASFTTSGTDGKIQYLLVSGDIQKTGGWQYQFRVVLSGIEYKSELFSLLVGERLT